MLTSIGRAASRRSLLSAKVLAPARLAHVTPRSSLLQATLPVRKFAVSAWARASEAAEGDAAPKKKKSTAAGATKKTKATATKPKAKPKAKAKPKKKVVPKKKKKVLTPEEKDKAELRELKKMALLKSPTKLPENAWSVYLAKNITSGAGTLGEQAKTLSTSFKALSLSEKESLQSTSQENHLSNQDVHRAWVDSHPPEAIYMANIARRRLARKLGKRNFLIHDDRLPKRATSPYILFCQSRFHNVSTEGSTQDTIRVIAAEWRNLSSAEQAPYRELAAADSTKSSALLKELRAKGLAYWKAQKEGGDAAKNQSSYPSP